MASDPAAVAGKLPSNATLRMAAILGVDWQTAPKWERAGRRYHIKEQSDGQG